MKDSKTNDDWKIAEALLNDLEFYAKLHGQTKNIQYCLYNQNGEYHIKIEKDEEHILQNFLEGIDE